MNIWITGASRGIGRAVAEQLLKDGHTVAATARTAERLDSLRNLVSKDASFLPVPVDVTVNTEILKAVEFILQELGSIDVFIGNAGVTRFKTIEETSIEEVDEIIDTNLKGMSYCIKAVLPSMLERRNGWILSTISVTAHKTFTKSGAYAASKSGLLSFINVLREEVRDKGIKVTAFIPGAVDTDMWPGKVRDKYRDRMMRASDIGMLVSTLLATPPNMMLEEILVRPVLGDL
jgi:NADP-dependent 3-hydroxy acid dehydrogenase YdfG